MLSASIALVGFFQRCCQLVSLLFVVIRSGVFNDAVCCNSIGGVAVFQMYLIRARVILSMMRVLYIASRDFDRGFQRCCQLASPLFVVIRSGVFNDAVS